MAFSSSSLRKWALCPILHKDLQVLHRQKRTGTDIQRCGYGHIYTTEPTAPRTPGLALSWHMQACCVGPARAEQRVCSTELWCWLLCQRCCPQRCHKSPLPILWSLCKITQPPENASRNSAELWDTEQTINRILGRKADLEWTFRDHFIQHTLSVVCQKGISEMIANSLLVPWKHPTSQYMGETSTCKRVGVSVGWAPMLQAMRFGRGQAQHLPSTHRNKQNCKPTQDSDWPP